jgi:hypothetical protein
MYAHLVRAVADAWVVRDVDHSAGCFQDLFRERGRDCPWALTGLEEAEFVQAHRRVTAVRWLQGEQPEAVVQDAAGVPLAEVRRAQDVEKAVVRQVRRASVVARELVPAQPQGKPDARRSARQLQRAPAVPREQEARRVPEQASPQRVQDARALERQAQERREECQALQQA